MTEQSKRRRPLIARDANTHGDSTWGLTAAIMLAALLSVAAVIFFQDYEPASPQTTSVQERTNLPLPTTQPVPK